MISLDLIIEGDGALKDWFKQRGQPVRPTEFVMTALEGGMSSGAPSVGMAFALPDGTWAFAETSLKLLLTAADALKARYGDPRISTTPKAISCPSCGDDVEAEYCTDAGCDAYKEDPTDHYHCPVCQLTFGSDT